MNREEATGRLQKELDEVKENMLEVLDIETSFEVAYVCESIYKLCGYKNIIDDDDLFEMKFNELQGDLSDTKFASLLGINPSLNDREAFVAEDAYLFHEIKAALGIREGRVAALVTEDQAF